MVAYHPLALGKEVTPPIDDYESIVDLATIPTLDNIHDKFLRSSINNVHKLHIDLFCNKLIDHFDFFLTK